MDNVIIFRNDDGSVSIIHPAPECGIPIMQIALKDVPFGRPFGIIPASDLPVDRQHRSLWTVDEADLVDGVGADYGVGSDHNVTGWTSEGMPLLDGIVE